MVGVLPQRRSCGLGRECWSLEEEEKLAEVFDGYDMSDLQTIKVEEGIRKKSICEEALPSQRLPSMP